MENSTQELKVESVSAISKTGVTVKFPALKEAKTDVTVEVKDASGKSVEVTPIKVLDVGETTATFTFKSALTTEPTGTWTVNGVSFDANAQVAVKAVKDAKNQVELLKALKSSYFTGVNADLIAAYDAEDFTTVTTVADVQKLIDKANSANISAEAVKAVKEAKNQVELLKALQAGGFTGVNADLIAAYDAADFTTVTTPASVQTKIDAVNLTAAKDAVKIADGTTQGATALTADAINKAQALVTALPEKTDSEKAAKKAEQNKVDMAKAVAKVKDATTQASLLSALKSPVLDLKNIDDTLAKYYKTQLDNKKALITTVGYDISGQILTAGKTKAVEAVVTEVGKVKADTPTADVKALLAELKRLDSTNFTASLNDALLEDYRTLLSTTDVDDKNTVSEINGLIAGLNTPTGALTTLVDAGNALDTSDKLLTALKAKTLNLKVTDANKDAYFKQLAQIKSAANTGATDAVKVANVKAVVDATDARVALNDATTDTAAQAALTKFAIASDNAAYINLSSTAKLEVAALIKEAQAEETDGVYATNAAVTSEIPTQNNARTVLVSAVNDASTITEANTALEAVNYKAFEDLTASQKVAVAEAFLANFPKDKDGVKVAYTTLTNIKADIDKAITAVAE